MEKRTYHPQDCQNKPIHIFEFIFSYKVYFHMKFIMWIFLIFFQDKYVLVE